MVASIDVVLNTQLTTSAEIQITVLRDHKVLENLDYENSGHTGFASEEFVNNAINNALESKVDKVAGKTLTSNDFTIEYKDRVDNNKQNIESLATQLSLYQFTRQQIVSKFLEDYSSYVGSSVTVENYLNAPRLTYEFLRNHSNWSWLKQWIISCRSDFETNQTWLTNFLDGNETFWAYEMKAFLSETYQATYPGSTDYTFDAYANGWRPPSTIDELNSRVSALEANKVDRVEGKGLSTNDYDNTSKEIVDNLLNEEGQINSNLLPSYVDDVMEFTIQVSGADFLNQIINQDIGSIVWIAASKTYTGDTYYRKFAINKDGTIEGLVIVEPESGKIYVGKSDTNTYRWSGSNLVEISKSIGLGETTTTAYAGNKGKANADAIAAEIVNRQNAINNLPIRNGSGDNALRMINAAASGDDSSALGTGTASGTKAHAEGNSTTASGNQSHAEGHSTKATANQTHAEGYGSEANANGAHAEGDGSKANGIYSHAEGCETKTTGDYAHSEGKQTLANGAISHAEGNKTIASGSSSHAEGSLSEAPGYASHAEGEGNFSGSQETHTEGESNVAQGYASHVQGIGNESTRLVQDVSGQYAAKDATQTYNANNIYVFKAVSGQTTYTIPSSHYNVQSVSRVRVNGSVVNNYSVNGHSITFSTAPAANSAIEVRFSGYGSHSKGNLMIVGNGSSDGNRSNAFTLDWNGNARFKGQVYVNANADGTGGSVVGGSSLYHHRIRFSAGYSLDGTTVTVYGYTDLYIGVDTPFTNTTFWQWYFNRTQVDPEFQTTEDIPCYGVNQATVNGVNYLLIIDSITYSEGIGEKLFFMKKLATDFTLTNCSLGAFTAEVELVEDVVFI